MPLPSNPLSRRFALGLLVVGCGCSDAPSAPPDLPPYQPPEAYTFPVSVRGGDIVDASGEVIVLNGDTPWSLVAQLDSADVLAYLDGRMEQGVNAVGFNAIEHLYADHAPENAYGEAPFRRDLAGGAPDFTALNPRYWAYVEWIVGEARSRGMVSLVFPAYVGYQFNDAGWSAEMKANGPTRLQAYGDSLGRRLGPLGNVIWSMGGDWEQAYGGVSLEPEIAALAAGIGASAPGALFTAHARRNLSALDAYAEPWLDINSTYSDTLKGPSRLLLDARRTAAGAGRAMPTIWIEGYYENEHGMDDEKLRAQVYWSLLSGGSGHFYGAHPVWAFGAPAAERFGDSRSGRLGWKDVLESRAAQELTLSRTIIDTYPVSRLDPLAEAGLWPTSANPRAPAVSWSGADSLVMAYVRDGRSVDLGPAGLSATEGGVWFDPRTGDRTPVGASTTDIFTPPTDEDWLLILPGVVHR